MTLPEGWISVVEALKGEDEGIEPIEYWRRDETSGFPKYIPKETVPYYGDEKIESVYIQPGGCVEISFSDPEEEDGDGGMMHICEFGAFADMIAELRTVWENHPERYDR